MTEIPDFTLGPSNGNVTPKKAKKKLYEIQIETCAVYTTEKKDRCLKILKQSKPLINLFHLSLALMNRASLLFCLGSIQPHRDRG